MYKHTSLSKTTLTLSGAGTGFSSDKRLKKHISTIKNAVNTVARLRGVNFTWRSNNRPDIGVIAQEVERVVPQVVGQANGFKTVVYDKLVALLIEAIKEQESHLENQDKKIRKLQETLALMQNTVY